MLVSKLRKSFKFKYKGNFCQLILRYIFIKNQNGEAKNQSWHFVVVEALFH